jgi:Carboxypeptidase regulatory-like domain/TonB dependent receptor
VRSVAAIAIAIVIEISAGAAAAQQSVEYASIGGRIVDPSGAVVTGAQVVARQVDTNFAAHATTDQGGRFRFPYLKVGAYEITVQQPGFADAVRRLSLTAGGAVDLPISLTLPEVTASVTVSAEAAVLDTARTQIAGTMPQDEIRNIPLNGRNFLDLALAIPGVSPANVGSTQLFPETSAVPGAGLSIASQRNLSNNFVVDGLSANDDAAGLSSMTYSVDAVEEFQVITSGAQAELGRALGGYLNIVTKSGTNRHQGDGYAYLRDDLFNARNPLTGSTLPMQQWQYGASAGGPLVRDRTFYFANAERRRLDQTGVVTIAPDAVRAINGRLSATGYRGPLVGTGLYQDPVRSTNVLTRIDHQIVGADLLTVRYSAYHVDAQNARGAGGLSAPSASAALDNVDHTIAASNTRSLSARVVNETRAQFAYSDLEAPPTDMVGPAVGIAGVATFGRLSSSPTARLNRMLQIVDNISRQSGAHTMRAGVDFLHNRDGITFPRSAGGSYTFSSLDNFLAGVYNNAGFTQTFGVTGVSQSNSNVGVYAQDEWKLGQGITLNYGLRYDLQFLETVTMDTDNVSPRVGLAWVPDASGRTVVRANVGVFYDRVPLRALANALLSAGNSTDLTRLRQINVSLTPGQAGAPVFPNILPAAVPSVTLVNLTTLDRHLRNAASRQGSVEVERQIGGRLTLNIGYQYLRGVGLLMSVNQNVPTCVASGTNNGCRPNSSYGNNSQYSSVGKSTYHGLQLSLLQRPASWGEYRVSYTLSKSMNNVGEFFFSSPIDPFDLSKDWGRSDDDQRHRLAITATARTSTATATTLRGQMTHGLQVSGMLQAYTALPLNVLSGATTVQGTAGRPVVNGTFIQRNAGVGSDFLMLNIRVSRTVRIDGRSQIEAIAEAFNLTNRVNVVTRNSTFGSAAYPTNPSPTFRQITAIAEPRSFQFGLRVKF